MICLARITFRYTIKVTSVVLYPLLVYVCFFGIQGLLDFYFESMVAGDLPHLMRYSTPQMEMKYILKTIVYDCFRVVYFNVFVPIYFANQHARLNDRGNFYVNYGRFYKFAFCQFMLNFLYYSTLYLYKRNFEMQFNSHVLGYWQKV